MAPGTFFHSLNIKIKRAMKFKKLWKLVTTASVGDYNNEV
jgi:hypothetical protein